MSEQKQERWWPDVALMSMVVLTSSLMVWLLPEPHGDAASKIQTLAILSSAFTVASVVLQHRFYSNIYIVTVITILSALTASVYSFLFILNPGDHTARQILATFVVGLLSWALFFHIIAFNFGYMVRTLLRRDSVIARNWVKAIDYIYLLISSFSILRIVVSTVTTAQG
jgi:hypothetical protein